MPSKYLALYAGVLVALAFVASGSKSDEYRCQGKKCRYYAAPYEDRQERVCAGKVRGLGTQWVGEAGALEAAKKDWMERVRYDLGESYLDLSNAEDFVRRCGRTSVGEVAGNVMHRCEIIARPCKGGFAKTEGQK
jgi:hypothetical protein